jgi:hypothetical protein
MTQLKRASIVPAPGGRAVKSKGCQLPGDLVDSICSFRDPLYEEVRLKGGTPSALAFKQFGVYNLHLEPWCRQRWRPPNSTYWIEVEKLDDPANPDLSLWVLGRSDGKWRRLWDHSWSDVAVHGNEPDQAALLERRAQICAGLRHSVSIPNRAPEETYGFRNSSAGCQQRAF